MCVCMYVVYIYIYKTHPECKIKTRNNGNIL